jgi:hypothetical protein
VRPTPTHALITLLAAAAGTLTGWYSPALVPGLIFGVLAYIGVVLLAAWALGLNRDQALLGTSRVLLLAIAVTLTAILRGCIYGLNALAHWDTPSLSRTGATAP